jgi:type I restriction enzyme R subunit
VRITGDSTDGKAELDDFISPEEPYPVIATTSKLLTTGVDAKTCKVIVLDQSIRSMTEFKQIIGRGTRILEEYGKLFFTIIDFRKATELFADPDFDGEPVTIYEPTSDDPVVEEADDESELASSGPVPSDGLEGAAAGDADQPSGKKRTKYVVQDVPVHVIAERVQYYGKDGKLITESLRDYSRKTIVSEYASLDRFLKTWSEADRKRAIVEHLEEQGVFFEELAREVGRDMSAFDLICHIAFDAPALTRKERANQVRAQSYFTQYGEAARAVLEALLDKFEREGVVDLGNLRMLGVVPLSGLGTPIELVERFGGREPYMAAVRRLEEALFAQAEPSNGPPSSPPASRRA